MREKIKTQIAVAILVGGIVIGCGMVYYDISASIKNAEQLTKEEKYSEAIENLKVVQVSWFVRNFKIKYKYISDKIKENENLAEDKSQYDKGITELENNNYQESINILSALASASFYYPKAQVKIEESKRKIVEEELGETKIAKNKAEAKAKQEEAAKKLAQTQRAQEEQGRKQAEAKAKQEEFEKKLKEQQLADKEAEEKMMNADNDGDGLTYRRELELGTSDWNTDSDGDGIKDGEDTHPAGGGRYIPQNFEWSYGGKNWTWTYSIHEDWYEYYKNKNQPRSQAPQGVEFITPNDPFIKEIAKALKEGAQKEGYAVSLFITSFVQALPYVQDAYTSFDEYPKYPIETFVERNGDCEDTSYLAASFVDAAGYGSALVELPGHMAIAIKAVSDFDGYYYDLDDGRYYFFETTGTGWELGDIPPEYKNKQAKITKVWGGKIINSYPQYKKPCSIATNFPGYYYDGKNFYSDSQCNNLTHCMSYKEFYVNPQITAKLYWDSGCSQEVTIGCYKSTDYPGYFSNDIEFYSDSRCTQKAKICRPSTVYSDRYWDGNYSYWNSNCTQKVVSGCDKSVYHPGLFFDGFNYYYDYQCTQEANPN